MSVALPYAWYLKINDKLYTVNTDHWNKYQFITGPKYPNWPRPVAMHGPAYTAACAFVW